MASAQNQNQNPNRETLKATGSIKAMGAGMIHLVTDDGEEWLVKLEARPDSVWYYAEAEPSWLQAGMLVQFSGRFDAKGQPQETIGAVKVVNARPNLAMGVKVDQGVSAGANLFSREEAPVKQQTISADVVGKIAGIKGQAISVATPNARIQAELAEKAIVSVELTTLQMAKIGDSVEVDGWYPKGMKGRAIASRVTVRAKEPLKGWSKPVATKQDATAGKSKDGKSADGKSADKSGAKPDPFDALNGPK